MREALRKLEQDGWIVAQPHRGYCVRQFAVPELDDIYIPLDDRATVADIAATLGRFQTAAAGMFAFSRARDASAALQAPLDTFYERVDDGALALDVANSVQRQLARLLVPVNFTREGRFWRDPALEVPALPDLAPAATLPRLDPGGHKQRVTLMHVVRGQNRLRGHPARGPPARRARLCPKLRLLQRRRWRASQRISGYQSKEGSSWSRSVGSV